MTGEPKAKLGLENLDPDNCKHCARLHEIAQQIIGVLTMVSRMHGVHPEQVAAVVVAELLARLKFSADVEPVELVVSGRVFLERRVAQIAEQEAKADAAEAAEEAAHTVKH